jgi:hypothetical protein
VTFTVGLFSNDCEGGVVWSIPIAEDNCEVEVTQTAGPAQDSILAVGLYEIEYTAEDSAGNSVICTFFIDVIDTEEPAIVCPGNDLFVGTDDGVCTWTAPVGSLTPIYAFSNCPATIEYEITGATTASGFDDASGETFELGTSTVTYTITEDSSGQSWTCSFDVHVEDDEDPVIEICPEPVLTTTDAGSMYSRTGYGDGRRRCDGQLYSL